MSDGRCCLQYELSRESRRSLQRRLSLYQAKRCPPIDTRLRGRSMSGGRCNSACRLPQNRKLVRPLGFRPRSTRARGSGFAGECSRLSPVAGRRFLPTSRQTRAAPRSGICIISCSLSYLLKFIASTLQRHRHIRCASQVLEPKPLAGEPTVDGRHLLQGVPGPDARRTRSHNRSRSCGGRCALVAPLEHRPERLDAVGVGHAVYVLANRVLDGLVVRHPLVDPCSSVNTRARLAV